MSKKTNRDWLKSLTNKQLAEFLTCGLYVKLYYPIVGNIITTSEMTISIQNIATRYIQSHTGIEHWLNSPQEFEVIPEVE